jgi:sugar/nucleoside kinase (ribokinase family)
LAQGHDYATAGKFANLAASKVVSQFGPRLKAQQHAQLKQQFFK